MTINPDEVAIFGHVTQAIIDRMETLERELQHLREVQMTVVRKLQKMEDNYVRIPNKPQ